MFLCHIVAVAEELERQDAPQQISSASFVDSQLSWVVNKVSRREGRRGPPQRVMAEV